MEFGTEKRPRAHIAIPAVHAVQQPAPRWKTTAMAAAVPDYEMLPPEGHRERWRLPGGGFPDEEIALATNVDNEEERDARAAGSRARAKPDDLKITRPPPDAPVTRKGNACETTPTTRSVGR